MLDLTCCDTLGGPEVSDKINKASTHQEKRRGRQTHASGIVLILLGSSEVIWTAFVDRKQKHQSVKHTIKMQPPLLIGGGIKTRAEAESLLRQLSTGTKTFQETRGGHLPFIPRHRQT